MRSADLDHESCQLLCLFLRLHKGSIPAFDIQQDRIGSGCQLLAHDTGRDQTQIIHRCCNVTQRVDLFVCRCDMSRLTDDCDAFLIDLTDKILFLDRRLKSRDRSQFIDSPAGKAQASSTHLGHRYTAGCCCRTCDQRRLVSDATSAVFIHLDASDPRKIHRISRLLHVFRQQDRFLFIHSLKINSHKERRHLIVRDISRGIAVYHVADLFGVQCGSIPLSGDHINCIHPSSSCRISSRMLSPIGVFFLPSVMMSVTVSPISAKVLRVPRSTPFFS